MNIRKIAVVGGFAVGAALTFAPLASADVTGIDPTTVVDDEISSLNSIFSADVAFAGDAGDTTSGTGTDPGSFLTVLPSDAPDSGTPTFLDYELYGVNPIAQASSDPGAYDVYNGALTEFDNAYNVELYSLFNGGAVDTNVGDYIDNSALETALSSYSASTTDAADYLFDYGIGDLSGFFNVDLSFLDLPV